MELNSVIEQLQLYPQLFDDIDKFSEQPGIYAFYYEGQSQIYNGIAFRSGGLLYIGKTESSQKSRDANTHFKSGKTGSSTVRRSLGAVLRQSLGLNPIPRNATDYSKGRFSPYKFDVESEVRLTQWMKAHVSMSFFEFNASPDQIDALETELINKLEPALNIEKNQWGLYREKMQKLRKSCAEIAQTADTPEIQQAFRKELIRKKDTQRGSGTGLYTNFWNQLLPDIEEMFDNCETPQSLQLEKKSFDQLGNRARYNFNIQYERGKVANNLSGSAVARDLNGVILKNMSLRSKLKSGDYKISMDSKFTLWVRQT
jgi:hypothetical protein